MISLKSSRREKHDVLLQRIPCSPSPSSRLAPPDFLRCRSSKFHIEDSPSCIGGRVRSLTQSRHLDMSGEAVSEASTVRQYIRKRHPGVAAEINTAHDQGHSSPSITAVRDSKEWLEAAGFEMPSWEALAQGARPKRPKPRGGDCGHSAKTWMAAPSISDVGAAPTHGTRTSSDVVPRRPHGRRTVLQFPNDEGDTFRFPALSPSLLASPPPSLASYCLPLPLWPSLGRLWPSTRSVRHSRSVGEARVCVGSQPPQGFAARQGEGGGRTCL